MRLIKQYHLEDVANSYIGSEFNSSLTYSQRKRVALCNVLIQDPPILLLDEITYGFDCYISETVIRNLQEEVESSGRTIIYSAHHPTADSFIRMARTWIFHKGRMIYDGQGGMSIIEHFKKEGFEFSTHHNPSDQILTILNPTTSFTFPALAKRPLSVLSCSSEVVVGEGWFPTCPSLSKSCYLRYLCQRRSPGLKTRVFPLILVIFSIFFENFFQKILFFKISTLFSLILGLFLWEAPHRHAGGELPQIATDFALVAPFVAFLQGNCALASQGGVRLGIAGERAVKGCKDFIKCRLCVCPHGRYWECGCMVYLDSSAKERLYTRFYSTHHIAFCNTPRLLC